MFSIDSIRFYSISWLKPYVSQRLIGFNGSPARSLTKSMIIISALSTFSLAPERKITLRLSV